MLTNPLPFQQLSTQQILNVLLTQILGVLDSYKGPDLQAQQAIEEAREQIIEKFKSINNV